MTIELLRAVNRDKLNNDCFSNCRTAELILASGSRLSTTDIIFTSDFSPQQWAVDNIDMKQIL